jgi:hypothetical protein
MTPEEAIKILTEYLKVPEGISLKDETTAILLGIEALKRITLNRHEAMPGSFAPLPGETPEWEVN